MKKFRRKENLLSYFYYCICCGFGGSITKDNPLTNEENAAQISKAIIFAIVQLKLRGEKPWVFPSCRTKKCD